ncbi:MAG: hypothetical protein Ct9H90mP16_17300 [Candidatus Poseidoniales archaeon]|nr:MAG: hypothetical protein Ct9H90mP16_17300 [Candidatus Poseidoniales archaeon]
MAEFNEECRNSVWTYEQAWREMTERWRSGWISISYVTCTMITSNLAGGH